MIQTEALKNSDPEISDEVFLLFSDLIYKTSGIKLSYAKKGLLISRLLRRLKLLRVKDFYDYYHIVKDNNEELIEMLNCISTHTTMFFRENYHFEYFRNFILPDLLARKQENCIRIWSAGCSTGEEPYSLAITVCEALRNLTNPSFSSPDIKILATDISTKVLENAEVGIYGYEQLPEDMSPDNIKRYFLKGKGEHEGKIMVKDFVKGLLWFKRFNLKNETYPFRRGFDAIFCRNVMIYFDEDMKRHVLSLFHHHLSDGGYLFLGHSETIIGKDKFRPVYITVYNKL